MERKFHGSESSLYGLFAPGNESAEERKGLESTSLHAVNIVKHVIAQPWASQERQWQLSLKSRVVGGLSPAPPFMTSQRVSALSVFSRQC